MPVSPKFTRISTLSAAVGSADVTDVVPVDVPPGDGGPFNQMSIVNGALK